MDSKILLKKFLIEWLACANGSTPSGWYFDESVGLCSNLEGWLYEVSPDYSSSQEYGYTIDQMQNLLREYAIPGKDINYPFGGQEVYNKEQRDGTMHLNEERVAWAKKTVSSL